MEFCKGTVCQLCSPSLLLGLWIRSTLYIPTEPRISAGAAAGWGLSGNESWLGGGISAPGEALTLPSSFCYELRWKSEIWKFLMKCIFRNYSGGKKKSYLNDVGFVSTFLLYKNGKTKTLGSTKYKICIAFVLIFKYVQPWKQKDHNEMEHVNAIEKNHCGGDETPCFDILLL